MVVVLNFHPPSESSFNSTDPPFSPTMKFAPPVEPMSTVEVSLYTTELPFHTEAICPERAFPSLEIV